MAALYSFTFADRSNEKSVITLNGVTGADAAAQAAAQTALQAAIVAVSAGELQSRRISTAEKLSNAIPVAAAALREVKARVDYEDTTTFKLHQYEIPIIDQNVITYQGNQTDFLNITNGDAIETLVTQMEAHCGSPLGNAINVIGIEVVGRSL